MADVRISVEPKAAVREGRNVSHSCDLQADMTDSSPEALLIHSTSLQRGQRERNSSSHVGLICYVAAVTPSKSSKVKVNGLENQFHNVEPHPRKTSAFVPYILYIGDAGCQNSCHLWMAEQKQHTMWMILNAVFNCIDFVV